MTAKINTKSNKKPKQKQKQKQKQSIVVNINLAKKQSSKSEPRNIQASQQLPPPVHKVYVSPIHNLEPQIFSGGVQSKQPSLADQINTYLRTLNVPQNTITPDVQQQASQPDKSKSKGGRPKGSKNKNTSEASAVETAVEPYPKRFKSEPFYTDENDLPNLFNPKVPTPFDKEEQTILKASQPDPEENEPSSIFNRPVPLNTPYESLTIPSVFQQFTEPTPSEQITNPPKIKNFSKKKSSKKKSSK